MNVVLYAPPPRDMNACLHVAHGYYLWRVLGAPEIWQLMATKYDKKNGDALPREWKRHVSLKDIPRRLRGGWNDAGNGAGS